MTTITSDTLLLYTDRHARVTAGPGAGKTYWLAEHTRNVLRRSKKLHSHARIGVISYTNVAADELRERIGPDSLRADVATIHSFLYHTVIRPYLYLIKKSDGQPLVNVQLVDGHDEHHVNHQKVEEWLTAVNYRTVLRDAGQVDVLKKALATIRWAQVDDPGAWRLELRTPDWLSRQLWRPVKAKLTAENLFAYKTLYWADGSLDHDDILYFAIRILHDHPIITECLSARYPFLFIDEFQDTVPAQTQIVHWIAQKGTTIAVIGDAEQSIFTFAGAQPEHFQNFTLAELAEYTIARNRRSTNRIIALLNHVRRDGLIQDGTRAEEGAPVVLLVGDPPQAAQHAKALLPENESLLILARNDITVQQAEQTTGTMVTEPWDAIEQADSRRKMLLGRLFAGLVLARARHFDVAITTILRGIRHNKGQLKEPFKTDTTRSAQHRRAIAITLLETLVSLGPALDSMTLRIAYEHCSAALTKDFTDLVLKQIRTGSFATLAERYDCGTLLRSVRLTNNEESRNARTIHKAKGTERPNVLVLLHGRNENETQERLNHILNPATASDEEQRITYVALSRARDRLFLATPAITAAQECRLQELGISVIHLDIP
jgi:DNA helicase-2/ATP-dependent DNA helicase PcrA